MSQIGILPTDTLYGLVTSALDPVAVEKIYELKKRQSDKPLIILLSERSELAKFDIVVEEKLAAELNKHWPGPVSIVLPLPNNEQISAKWHYLHRGTNTLAFRLPAKPELLEFLQKSGPLVAPSANPEGRPPAETLAEARKYFGDQIDFYLGQEEERLSGSPSTILQWDGEKMLKIR